MGSSALVIPISQLRDGPGWIPQRFTHFTEAHDKSYIHTIQYAKPNDASCPHSHTSHKRPAHGLAKQAGAFVAKYRRNNRSYLFMKEAVRNAGG